jgi:molybdopterin-guanine dinucleotide biosynthesis protein A
MVEDYAAVILAGGTAARMDGVDKATLEYAGRPLLEHALAAVSGAVEVVVVGDAYPTSRPVTFVREEPRQGGPAAGLLAGRDAVAVAVAVATLPRFLAVLAVDMPRVRKDTFARLLTAASGHDGAFLTDGDGRRQLVGVVDLAALDATRPDDAYGLPLHRLLAPLDLAVVEGLPGEAADVDTWTDLRELDAQ